MWEPVDERDVFLTMLGCRLVGMWALGGGGVGLIWHPLGVTTVIVAAGSWVAGVSVGYGWQGVGTSRVETDRVELYVVCLGLLGWAWGSRRSSEPSELPLDGAVFA